MEQHEGLALEFLNSEWRDFRGRGVDDRLQKAEWRVTFFQHWQLEVDAPVTAEVMQQLLALRQLLRRLVESLPQQAPAPQDILMLNQMLRHAPSVTRLHWNGNEYSLEHVPLARDWNWVMAEIATSFVRLLVSIDTRRLKACENTYCRFIFIDESHGLTRLYCCHKCSNLVKLRRFRARQRVAQAGSSHE